MRLPPGAQELIEAIRTVADRPTHQSQEAFVAAFIRSEVGAFLPPNHPCHDLPDGTKSVTTSATTVQFPLANPGPEGCLAIVAYASPQHPPPGNWGGFFTIPAARVLEMAVSQNAGIVVQGHGTWGYIARAHAAQALAWLRGARPVEH